ncbi:RNA polymerase II [Trichoplusia ni ascovirus 6b]|nr:RNA polymerase II [Trichoplusia ni ascovirus 6b]
MIVINEDMAMNLVDFIRPRENLPLVVEEPRVKALREHYANQLKGCKIPRDALWTLKKAVMNKYFEELATPGDCVGIACAQSIGECITQSTLNTFHAAGMDTGIMTTMRKIEDIINLPKTGLTQVTLYPADPEWSLQTFYERTRHFVECVTFEDLIVKSTVLDDGIMLMELDLYKLFKYRIDIQRILQCLHKYQVSVPNYEDLSESSTVLPIRICIPKNVKNKFRLKKCIQQIRLVGLPGVVAPHRFVKQVDDKGVESWCLECYCKSIKNFVNTHAIYNALKTTTNRLRDAEQCYGIEVTKAIIIDMSNACLSESVPKAIITLMANRLTHSGHVEPFTRFTMRSNISPLAKIGFEECLEGCRNAGLFKESERFKTVSSSIICGIMPKVGSNYSKIYVNLDNYSNNTNECINDWYYHDDNDHDTSREQHKNNDTIYEKEAGVSFKSIVEPDDGLL